MTSTGKKTKKETFDGFYRFEARCYNTASGFHTVWGPLTQQNNIQRMNNITTRHLYFLSKILQDSLLTRKLNQAIAALLGFSGKCEKVIELFCLAGLEILKSIPHSHTLCLKFYKNMYLACYNHQQEILLNFALYLVLRQHDIMEGLELLKSKSNRQQFEQSLMQKAYIALFEYILYQPKKTEASVEGLDVIDSDDEQENIFNTPFMTKSNLDFSLKRSMVLFEEVFASPGIWDMFIPAYIELLKKSGGGIKVQKFLGEYRDKNPLNPNAHRYLYHSLKSNLASDEEMMNVLEDLIKLDSTSEYLEDLIQLKLKSGDMANIVRMLFEKLDHSAFMFDEKTWTQLESYLQSGGVKTESGVQEELELCWEVRKNWWPKYHFRLARNFVLSDGVRTVMLCKARIAEYFLGPENKFSYDVRSKYGITKDDRLQDVYKTAT